MSLVKYKLKKGTHSTGSIMGNNLKVYRACDKENNIIEIEEDIPGTLAIKEPERYEVVPGTPFNAAFAGAEEYGFPNDPEVLEAEAQRLLHIAKMLKEKKETKDIKDTPVNKESPNPSYSSPLNKEEDSSKTQKRNEPQRK